MANKINLEFFNAYLDLDKLCKEYFEISGGGVSAYIGRLSEFKSAPGRKETLSRLIKYRKIRNILAHEADGFDDITDITKDDIKWLNEFAKSVKRKADPVSLYERKRRINDLWLKLRFVFLGLGVVAVIVTVILIINLFK